MEINIKKEESVKEALKDIIVDMSWAKIAKKYFDKSPSWLYHKIDGRDGNGVEKGFTTEELAQFKGALYDFSERVRRCADKI